VRKETFRKLRALQIRPSSNSKPSSSPYPQGMKCEFTASDGVTQFVAVIVFRYASDEIHLEIVSISAIIDFA
jgi:hypothetical protein